MELVNVVNFVPQNKEYIDNVAKQVSNTIKSLNIDMSGQLSVAKLLKINGEINKAIKNHKNLVEAISKVPDGEKTGVIIAVVIEVINTEEFKSILSEEQRKQVEDFCRDTETAEAVVGLVDWIADTVLESMDKNKDGVVTEDEIQQSTKCCPCFSKFFLKFLCCKGNEKQIVYDEARYSNQPSSETKTDDVVVNVEN